MNPTDPEVSDTGLAGEERTLDRRELLGLGAAGLLSVPLLGSGVDARRGGGARGRGGRQAASAS